MQILKKVCWYSVLSPTYSTEFGSSSDALTLATTTASDKRLNDLPAYKALMHMFSNKEIIRWGVFQVRLRAAHGCGSSAQER